MYICWGQSCLLRCGIPVHNVPSPGLSPNLLPLPSARRAKGCGRQALQLQHGHRGLEGPRWWQAERGHTRLPDLHPAQEHGERRPPSLYILIILFLFMCFSINFVCPGGSAPILQPTIEVQYWKSWSDLLQRYRTPARHKIQNTGRNCGGNEATHYTYCIVILIPIQSYIGGCPDQEGRWHPVPASDCEDPGRSPLQTWRGPQVSGTNSAQIPLFLWCCNIGICYLPHKKMFMFMKMIHCVEIFCCCAVLLPPSDASPQLSPGADI